MGQNNGDSPRPFSVNLEKFADNFDLIFGKKDKPVKTYTGGQAHYVTEQEQEPIPFAGMMDIEEEKKDESN
jgi:hypothetical protein